MVRLATIIILCLPLFLLGQSVVGVTELNLPETYQNTMTVLKSGNTAYVRSKYDANRDIVQIMTLNGVCNFQNVRVIANTAPNTTVAYAAGELVMTGGDDATPNNFNNTYIGGNHGCSDVREVVSTGHGKTSIDVGSRWVDGASRTYYLVKIVSVNALWFMGEDLTPGDIWSFNTVITGNLTHVSGATNTSTINVGSYAGSQLVPAVKNVQNLVLLNGKTSISSDGLYAANFVDVINNYDIIDPSSIVSYLSSHIGQTDFTKGDSVVGNAIRYRFDDKGGCKIYHDLTYHKEVNIGYMGFIQVGALPRITWPDLRMYIPRTVPMTLGGTPYDFTTIEDWSTPMPGDVLLGSSRWADSYPPERVIEYISDGDNVKHGFSHGYNPLHGIGSLSNRASLVDYAWYFYSSNKSYPHGIDSKLGNIPAGTNYKGWAYRCWFPANQIGNKSSFYEVDENNDILFFVDYHTTVTNDTISIPAKWQGYEVGTVYKSANLTINHTNVQAYGVTCTVSSGSYAYACLRLKKRNPNLIKTSKIF